MEHYVEHANRPGAATAPSTPRSLRLSDRESFGVMELAENRHAPAQGTSFDNFVPPQYLIDGWILVVERRQDRSHA